MSENAAPVLRPRLRNRLLLWLAIYIGAISLIVLVSGAVLYEQAERTAWHSLLNAEMERHLRRSEHDDGYRWSDDTDLRLFNWNGASVPTGDVADLTPGLHEDVWVEGQLCVVLVRDTPQGRLAIALDITQFDVLEMHVGLRALLLLMLIVLGLGALLAVAIGRIVRPLTLLAEDIVQLQPERSSQRLVLPRLGSREQQVITEEFNRFLQRNDRFIERERVFINTASHELRTPIAGIAGAAQLALQQADLTKPTQDQLQRIRRSAAQVEQLIQLLLVLAKDPKRLVSSAETIVLHEVLPQIVEDHRYLTLHKRLQISLVLEQVCVIRAPMVIVQAAIGNLLRNAIEYSDGGTIVVGLSAGAEVTITDPGHGMSPEEVALIYARLVRGEGRDQGGIGLDLIARLCEHLGWSLDIQESRNGGTTASLRFQDGRAESS